MKVAFAIWNDRIAPVFDVARQVHIVAAEAGHIIGETRETIADDVPLKALGLTELGAGALVCGAISRPLQSIIESYGIRVIPFVSGELREVIRAWLSDTLESGLFAMPGCCGRKRRCRRVGRRTASGSADYCGCARCGYLEPCEPGIPCARKKCPKCGIPLNRL